MPPLFVVTQGVRDTLRISGGGGGRCLLHPLGWGEVRETETLESQLSEWVPCEPRSVLAASHASNEV